MEEVRKYDEELFHFNRRYLFRTAKGYIGMTYGDAPLMIGDCVALVPSLSELVLLQKAHATEDFFYFIG